MGPGPRTDERHALLRGHDPASTAVSAGLREYLHVPLEVLHRSSRRLPAFTRKQESGPYHARAASISQLTRSSPGRGSGVLPQHVGLGPEASTASWVSQSHPCDSVHLFTSASREPARPFFPRSLGPSAGMCLPCGASVATDGTRRTRDARVPLRPSSRRPARHGAAYDLAVRGEAASVVLADVDPDRARAAPSAWIVSPAARSSGPHARRVRRTGRAGAAQPLDAVVSALPTPSTTASRRRPWTPGRTTATSAATPDRPAGARARRAREGRRRRGRARLRRGAPAWRTT